MWRIVNWRLYSLKPVCRVWQGIFHKYCGNVTVLRAVKDCVMVLLRDVGSAFFLF